MQRRTILIADDDIGLLAAMSTRFESLGFEVITTQDAYQALDRARRTHPDAMVLDVHMPAGEGFSVMERLAAIPELAGTPCIIMTGDDSPEVRRHAESAEAFAMLSKPFEMEELVLIIQAAVRRVRASAASGR
ncbi:MAG: response regulator [Phycisphaerales bacterium]